MSKNDRFQIVQEEGNGLTSNHRMVLADTTTGVQYLFVKVGYAGGLCPLVDRGRQAPGLGYVRSAEPS